MPRCSWIFHSLVFPVFALHKIIDNENRIFLKDDGKEIWGHEEGHTFSRNVGTVGEFSFRYKCPSTDSIVDDKNCHHSGWDGMLESYGDRFTEKQQNRVCCKTSSNDYATLATYCGDKNNHQCRAIIIDGDEVLVAQPVDVQDTEFRGLFTVVKNYFPSELLFSDGLLKTDLVQGYSLSIMLGFEKMAHQFSINCDFRDDCTIVTKTRNYAMSHLDSKSAGRITGEHVTNLNITKTHGEDCGAKIDSFEVDGMKIKFPGTNNTMLNEVKKWMLDGDRCTCNHDYQLDDYYSDDNTNHERFTCKRDPQKHEFKFEKPFPDSKFDFVMTNDLYAVQQNRPVKRLAWKNETPSWKKVKIDGLERPNIHVNVIRCNQIDPFYSETEIVNRTLFNLIGCLLENDGKLELTVYKTRISNNEVEWISIAERQTVCSTEQITEKNILKLTVKADPLTNRFLFFLFTDNSEDNPLLPALNYNIADLFDTEFTKYCGTSDKKSSLARNTHLCTKTITLRDEIIPTSHGFIIYNYADNENKFTEYDTQLQKVIAGLTLTAFHRYHPEELNERMKTEKILYSIVPPVKHILNMNCAKKREAFESENIRTHCGVTFEYQPGSNRPDHYCPFDHYTGLRGDGGNMQFSCEHGYVCTNAEYWCYAGGPKHKIYRWFDDLTFKTCRGLLHCGDVIKSNATETVSIEGCARKFNEYKENFFASKHDHSKFVHTNSSCIEEVLTTKMTRVRNWSKVVITEYEKSVDPRDKSLSTGWVLFSMLVLVLIVFLFLVFIVKLRYGYEIRVIRKEASESHDMFRNRSRNPQSENVYVNKLSKINAIKNSFEYQNCIRDCDHTHLCVKSMNRVMIFKKPNSKLECVSWFPGMKKYILLKQYKYFINEMRIVAEASVDDGTFRSQQILGYYIHHASSQISNSIKCWKSKRVVQDEELELLSVSRNSSETEIEYIPLNSLLNETGQCYLVVRLQGDPDKDIWKTLFEVDINDLRSYGFNIMYQIYSFLKKYHGEGQAYGPFFGDIDTDEASIRVHKSFVRTDSFRNVRDKMWFKSKLFHDVGIETERTMADDLKDFCLLANRMMFHIFEETDPLGLEPDWSSLDFRIRQVTEREGNIPVVYSTHPRIWEQKESIRTFLTICEKMAASDYSTLENMFMEFEGRTRDEQISVANR